MENQLVSMNLDKGLVEQIITKQVQAAVIAQMGNPEDMMIKIIQTILSKKVDENGNHRDNQYYDKYDYIELMSTKAIHAAVQKYIGQWFEKNAEKIKKFVYTEMSKASRIKSIAAAVADAAGESMKRAYKLNVNLKFEQEDNSCK